MSEASVIQLFPISVYHNKINIDEDIKKFIISQEYERMYSGNGDFTVNKYLLNTPECVNLKKQISEQLDVFTRKYLTVKNDINFYMQCSWGVKHKKGDWGQQHEHANSLLSGVLYLETDKDSGSICFHKPYGYTNLFHSSTHIPFNEFETHNADVYHHVPENGDILLFPSHLHHSIKENRSNIIRYSIAFNFHISGELKTADSKIDYLKIEENKPYE
jgi:uncharacterized protein (TIGR02466 family)